MWARNRSLMGVPNGSVQVAENKQFFLGGSVRFVAFCCVCFKLFFVRPQKKPVD